MRQLAWRSADPSDKPALQAFECTSSVKRRGRTTYPRPWERQIETAVRRVNPRCNDGAAILVGDDPQGIGAVVSVGVFDIPGRYLVEALAVATRHRRRGGQVADEALEEAMQWVLNRADAARQSRVEIVAEVHPRNEASRWMLTRNGFTLLAQSDELDAYIYELDVPAPV